MPERIKTLYIDFDGVIINTIETIVSLYNEDFQYYKGFKTVNWWEVNTWDFEECSCASKKYINSYFNTPRFFNKASLLEGAWDVLNQMKDDFHLVIVSMGYRPNLVGKKLWIEKNLPFADFIGVNMKKYPDKKHIDMSDGIFIDDSSKNLATSNAKYKVLFGDVYPWNEDWEGKRCFNWTDLEKYLMRGDYVKT